jgi:aminoglycoside phosphotransferase (APT) family kinase protein
VPLITQPEVAAYLLRHDLVSAASIVEGDLAVADASRRNRNFKVISERGPSYLLKQGVGPGGKATVAHEAVVYEFLRLLAGNNGLDEYLPRYYGYDMKEQILVLELVRNAQDFREYHARRGRFSILLARTMGKALATVHRLSRTYGIEPDDGRIFPVQPPGALSIHRPDSRILLDVSAANVELIKVVQRSPKFCRSLDELREGWRTETLIHSDIKWDNCVIFARPSSKRKTRLKIVDWEAAGMGDPCWDIGSVFSNYLSFWLLSIPIMGEDPSDRFIELARYPLETMQPAMRSFWQSYARYMELDAATSGEWLLRAVKYVAARLVQTGYERTQMSPHLTGNVVCLLQLGLNILQRPPEAIVHLLGLPLRQAWSP